MVPVSSIVTMAVCAVLGIVAPFLLAWWMVKKYRVRPVTILVGAGVFIVFALGLESVVHQVVLKGPSGPAILGNIWYYALYGGCMAALFEECGRFLGMKYLLKKDPSEARVGVAYGIGHGGAEVLMLFGITMISNLVMSFMINTGTSDALFVGVPPEAQEQVQAQLTQLQTAGPGQFLLGIWERVSALILQVALSVMMWIAVRKGGKWLWLIAGCFLLHYMVDFCVAVLAKSASVVATEAICFAMAIAAGAAAFLLARRCFPVNSNA